MCAGSIIKKVKHFVIIKIWILSIDTMLSRDPLEIMLAALLWSKLLFSFSGCIGNGMLT